MVPSVLMRAYGHADCGIYVSVAQGGEIAVGDPVSVEAEDRAGLPFA